VNRELVEELKAAGFPMGPYRSGRRYFPPNDDNSWRPGAHRHGVVLHTLDLRDREREFERGCFCPNVAELIEACGRQFGRLYAIASDWIAESADERTSCLGKSPDEALGRLWLALNKRKQDSSGRSQELS
jgi:hypothetical protein